MTNATDLNIWWWAKLLVAVLAVPAIGFIVVSMFSVEGMMQIAIFMATCWVCVYLGMRLMQNPKIAEKLRK